MPSSMISPRQPKTKSVSAMRSMGCWCLAAILLLSHSTASAFRQIIPVPHTGSGSGKVQRSAPALALARDDYEASSFSSSTAASTSLNFALSPTSETAKRIVRENLGLTSEQYQQLAKLAVLVDDWNSRVNLISRKDCSPDVVFGRHILPSLAPLALMSSTDDEDSGAPLELAPGKKVCDVGTGGGFPGLPLAIALPDVDFLLVDSVGKKINAVRDMADQLGLTNVKTYHGRAESISGDFAWVTGRSVSALPTFCFWIHHLLEKRNGRLVYLIGGEIDEDILDEAIVDEEIEELLDVPGVSDKRVLVFPKAAVDLLAEVSGETLKVPKRGGAGDGTRARKQGGPPSQKKKKAAQPKKKNDAKGQWTKRDSSSPKDRGYSNFKRFDSLEN